MLLLGNKNLSFVCMGLRHSRSLAVDMPSVGTRHRYGQGRPVGRNGFAEMGRVKMELTRPCPGSWCSSRGWMACRSHRPGAGGSGGPPVSGELARGWDEATGGHAGWTPAARLEARTVVLDETIRGIWCQQHGIYVAGLPAWKRDVIAGPGQPRGARAVESVT